jgi:hypothetical protein
MRYRSATVAGLHGLPRCPELGKERPTPRASPAFRRMSSANRIGDPYTKIAKNTETEWELTANGRKWSGGRKGEPLICADWR